MDDNASVSELQRSESNVHDISASRLKRVGVDSPRKLVLRDEGYTKELIARYDKLTYSRPPTAAFAQALLQDPRSWFVELGDVGLLYLTNVTPHHSAMFNYVDWDGKLTRDRREVIRGVLTWVMEDLFDLPRIAAQSVPENQAWRRMLKDLGFVLEGALRDSVRSPDGTLGDLVIYGLLRRESCGCLKIPVRD